MFIQGSLARESGFVCRYNCGLEDSLLGIANIFRDVLRLYQAKEWFYNLSRQSLVRR